MRSTAGWEAWKIITGNTPTRWVLQQVEKPERLSQEIPQWSEFYSRLRNLKDYHRKYSSEVNSTAGWEAWKIITGNTPMKWVLQQVEKPERLSQEILRWGEFYSRLRSLKDYHRKYPNEVSSTVGWEAWKIITGNTPMKWVLQQVEKPEKLSTGNTPMKWVLQQVEKPERLSQEIPQWSEFYSRLRSLKDYHRKYPNEVSSTAGWEAWKIITGNTPMKWVLQQVEKPERLSQEIPQWSEFYSRLRSLKDYHRKYPNEVRSTAGWEAWKIITGNTPMKWVLQQVEKPERLSQEIPQWSEVYSRLRSLKDYHRKYPNEVSSTAGWEAWKIITGNTPMKWVLQQVEKPERLSQEIPQRGEFYSRLRSLKDYHRKYPNEVSSTAGWEAWKIITGNTPMKWGLQQVEKPERLSQEIPQWSEFYSRLRSLKDYHRKYPNEVRSTAGWEAWKIITGNTPMKWVLQQVEKPERLSQEIPQWGEFYSRLRSLKDYHRKYPNEVSSTAGWEAWKIITGNTPMKWGLQQVEKPERLSQEIPQWGEFYSRLRSLKDYHRKYPNEVRSTAGWEAWKIITGNTPMKWVLQ